MRHDASVTRVLFRLAAVLSVAAAVAALGVAPGVAKPGPADPHGTQQLSRHIRAVNARLDQLSRQSAQLDEQYNVAAAGVVTAKQTAKQTKEAAARAAAGYQAAHARFVQAVTQLYVTGLSPSVGTLLTTDAPQQYLDSFTMDRYLTSQFAGTARAVGALRAEAARATQRAEVALAAARTTEAAVAERKSALAQQSRRFQQLLGALTERQRRERAHARAVAAAAARAALADQQRAAHERVPAGGPASAPSAVAAPVSGSVQKVIAFAEAQVGKAYSYGAAGPSAFDCSGLTMAAWAQAGVSLPHSAADQYNYGTHVGYSELQPGDLIFLYSPIGHVELYVGRDLAVSAADPSIGIVYVHPSQDLGSYVGATRLTG